MRGDGSFDEAEGGGRTIAWACRQAVIWGAVAIAALILVRNSSDPALPSHAAAPAAPAQAAQAASARNTLVYPVDARGQVQLDADVDGATVHFIVDTGATLVTLARRDAEAAGINPAGLTYSMAMDTANGRVRAAPVTLRGVRLGQLMIDDVQGVVVPNLSVSLLGMSFLSRLDHWEMRGGALTISY